MKNALIFQAVVALVVVPAPLCLGLFGRKQQLQLRRVRSDLGGKHGAPGEGEAAVAAEGGQ
jgi:hypothetical protein